MLGGLYGLEKNQKRILILNQLAPTIVALSSLLLVKDALLTLISVQLLAYIGAPYLYIKYISKEKELGPYFLNEFRDRKKQIQVGTSLMMSSVLLIFLAYLMIYEFKTKIIFMLSVPLSYNPFYMTLFLLIMIFVNPILEEWFWRIYIQKTYEDSGLNSWMINANYAIFHFLVLCSVGDWKIALGLTSTFFSIGKSFEYIIKKYGFITGVLTHFGVAASSMVCFLDILYLESKYQTEQSMHIAA